MRISRYGGGFFRGGSGRSAERSARFRKKYRVGEIIQGTLLKWERSRLGWVQIDDLRLLANVLTDPSPGDVLTFIVQQLYPDIVLKEVDPDYMNAQGTYVDPTDVTRDFVRCRASFQARAGSLMAELEGCGDLDCSGRREQFLKLMSAEPETASLFFQTLKCAADLNSVLNSSRLFYMPWLVPTAMNQEIVLKIKTPEDPDNSFYELLYALDFPPSVPLRLRIMYKKPQCGFKLLTNDQNLGTLLGVHYKHSFPDFIGVEKIPAHSAGGFLSELLSG